jgi:hypothetical protein
VVFIVEIEFCDIVPAEELRDRARGSVRAMTVGRIVDVVVDVFTDDRVLISMTMAMS